MKIKITKVLPTSAHYGAEYSLIGTIGEVEKISLDMCEVSGSEYYGKQILYVEISNCKHLHPNNQLLDGFDAVVFGAEFEVVEY